jgi:hypothetical protein
MAPKIGLLAKLFYKSGGWGGTFTTPYTGWTELKIVEDNKLNESKGKADAATRGDGGNQVYMGALFERELELTLRYDRDDAGYRAMEDSFHNRTTIGIACLDGPLVGGEGIVGDFEVMKFERDERLKEVVKINCTICLTVSAFPCQPVVGGVLETTTAIASTTAW